MIYGEKHANLPPSHTALIIGRAMGMINRCLSITAFTLAVTVMTLASAAGTEIGQIKILTHGTLAIISGDIAKHSPDAMMVRTRRTILGVRGARFLIRVED